ncbi:hypothetical protein SAMN05216412_102472 [Nitrosospira multiformis]|uniref:Uncharacterized protein n=1 Tax=Nitrosospira multiformis TaxID=1231 RepID=A0A1I0B0Y6_9PROT|nr:hypothetical protein [Nitrosospira multiformis]SET00299.1 hypothetical protein SAMN05216412_102472 [Nitrosospira multiformis]
MGKREYHLLHAGVISVQSSREHGYIEDGFLSGGTEDCMRKLSLSLRGLPVEVSFILTEEEGQCFLAVWKEEKLELFNVAFPVEHRTLSR